MGTAYATRRDVYTYGLPRGLMANGARVCASALASTGLFVLDLHGFEDGDAVTFGALEAGALPAPIVAGTTYYVLRESDNAFRVAAAAGDPPVTLTSDGVGVRVAMDLPFDEILEFYSRFVDSFLIGHQVPLTEPIPVTIKGLVAELTAQRLLRISNQKSESMDQVELAAKAQLERFAKGVVTRDPVATPSANLAVVGKGSTDTRGWGSGRRIL